MIKSNDIALIILIISITFVVAWFGAGSIINSPENRSQEVEIVTPIDSEFVAPPPSVFNDDAINPAETINIEDGTKEQPFLDSSE